MCDVTAILSAINQGDRIAAEKLLPLVYDELRKLAAQQMAQEKPGQTLDATALVHEAYLRLVDSEGRRTKDEGQRRGESRRPFYPPAAEPWRRTLAKSARRKKRWKHGGGLCRVELREEDAILPAADEQLLT